MTDAPSTLTYLHALRPCLPDHTHLPAWPLLWLHGHGCTTHLPAPAWPWLCLQQARSPGPDHSHGHHGSGGGSGDGLVAQPPHPRCSLLQVQAAKVVSAHAASVGDTLLGVPLHCSVGRYAEAVALLQVRGGWRGGL